MINDWPLILSGFCFVKTCTLSFFTINTSPTSALTIAVIKERIHLPPFLQNRKGEITDNKYLGRLSS